MKTILKLSRRVLVLATLLLAGAVIFGREPLRANVTIVYGVAQNPVGTYIAALPIGTRPVLIGNRQLFLSNGIYYEAVMLQGRVVYRPVETTWQR